MSEVSGARSRKDAAGDLLVPGTRVGKYEIVHRIAFGGMAEIYLARVAGIHGFEKYLVLKRILPQYAANGEFVRMFLQEARVAASLDHANIAHVYDIGEIGGNYFFTMEYLHGEDLRWIIRQLDKGGGARLPLEHALEIVTGAASGLHFAHEKRGNDGRLLGIVHRDVSPANLVVTYDGGVKVVDFGIAKMTADPEFSRDGSLKGKLAYMSPEQIHSQPIDRRSDVYALGIVLYEITTHERLFKGADEVETMRNVLEGAVPPPSQHVRDYPPALERIVMRALEKDPGKRYQSARDLQLELEAFARDERVRVSSAALAEWMEKTFGPKRELWHELPPPPPSPPPPVVPIEPTAATRIGSPRPEVLAAVSRNVDHSVPIELSAPLAKKRRAGALGPVALGLALIAGVAVWSARGRLLAALRGDPSAAPAASQVLLVTEQGSVAVEPGGPRPAAPPPAAVAAATAPSAVAPSPAPEAQPPQSTEVPGAEPSAAPPGEARGARARANGSGLRPRKTMNFSETFARREGEIRRCFVGHTGDAVGGAGISLRFEIGRDGRVGSAAVLPESVAVTPLGACLAKIGKSTVFAPQPAPVAIRIPLTVQLQPGPSAKPAR